MIPVRHRPQEFSLRIEWRPWAGQRSFKGIPGFYLTAGFGNEGEAHLVAENVRIGAQALTNTLTMLSGDPSVDNALMNLGGPLSDAHDRALSDYHRKLVLHARALKDQLAEAEAAVAAAGLEGAL